MDLHDAIRAVRRGWLMVAVLVAVFGGSAAALVMSTAPEYTATSRGLVSVSSPETRQQYVLATGSQYIIDRMTSYAQLGVTSRVLAPVIDELRLRENPLSLSGRITSSSQVDTALLTVDVRHPDPVLAASIADLTMRRLGAVIEGLEGGKVIVGLAGPAAVPAQPSNRNPLPTALFAAFAGLVLGLALVLVRAAFSGHGVGRGAGAGSPGPAADAGPVAAADAEPVRA